MGRELSRAKKKRVTRTTNQALSPNKLTFNTHQTTHTHFPSQASKHMLEHARRVASRGHTTGVASSTAGQAGRGACSEQEMGNVGVETAVKDI